MVRRRLDLDRIKVVLVEPLYGGNVGQTARAMMNFDLSRLVLVKPREHLTAESYWMAREGKSILEEAEVHDSIEEALHDTQLAVGTTRRVGKYRRPAMTPEAFAEEVAPLTEQNTVALLFGREDSGLSAKELGLCQWIVTIPASDNFPSLNLAQAVLLIAHALFRTSQDPATETTAAAALRLAGPAELERFYAHAEDTLTGIGFLTGDQAPAILTTIRRIFGRANLEARDVKILRGILGQMDWYRRNAQGPVLTSERREGAAPATGEGASSEPGGSPEAASGKIGVSAETGASRKIEAPTKG